ncbi:sialate O-acetylesterase [Proteus mirabilis]|uniref:tail fiber/spike domain-containing protein n=1 Tax=Proteus mirabilis TaxID=584 RepID=UPI0024E10840|nr:sialate O-acetylesterase [Proteus mirabilis]
MSTIPTQNPVPSEAAKDLKFNSGKIDEFVTSLEHEYKDRFGINHMTIEGMRWIFEQLMERFKVDINQAIIAVGYITIDSFQQGAEITKRNEILRDENTGEYYRWDGDLPKSVPDGSTPESSGGVGIGAWVSVGDSSLRGDLSKNKGSSMIGDDKFSSVSEGMSALKDSIPYSGSVFDIFIIYGQSNAVGLAKDSPGYPSLINPSKSLFYNVKTNKMEVIKKNMPYTSGEVSTGHAWASFANKYISETGRGVILIPAAKGGVPLVNLLKDSESGIYSSLIAGYNSAINLLDGVIVDKTSVIWHQGENDQSSGNTREFYVKRLNILINDLDTDVGIDKFYILQVGNPQNRPDKFIQDIQFAQEDICSINPKAELAFKMSGKFTKANGLLASWDGVHYSQYGYNLMGLESAISISKYTKIPSRSISEAISPYGNISVPMDRRWRKLSAVARMDAGVWKLLTLNDEDNSGFRTSSIRGLSVNESRMSFESSTPITDVLGLNCSVNMIGEQYKVKPVITFRREPQQDGYNKYLLDVSIIQDFHFYCDGKTGEITRYPDGSSPPYFIEHQIKTQIDGDVLTITHPISTYGFPVVQSYGSYNLDKASTINISIVNTREIKIKFNSDDNYRRIMVSIPNCEVNPLLTRLGGLQIRVDAIASSKEY